MRYFFHIAYEGTRYSGWQYQENTSLTVQGVLQETLSEVLKTEITIIGCGRTDAGVHAENYIFHLDVDTYIEPRTLEILNMRLPSDIIVYDAVLVSQNAHARFDAVSRTYHYYFHRGKNIYLDRYSTSIDSPHIDTEAMNKAAAYILEIEDFRHVCKTPMKHNTTLCKVSISSISKIDNDEYRWTITGNRFLRMMVRILFYNLTEIGCGRITPDAFKETLQGTRPRKKDGIGYPQGLHLADVEYPYLQDLKNRFYK